MLVFFADDGEHLVGQPFGQAGLGKHHADHDRAKDEEHGRIHEILESNAGTSYQKKGLGGSKGDTGYTDWHHLENPPGGG